LGEHPWIVRLTAAAEADYQNILAWTSVQFGDLQARVYADTLSAALVELTAGPATPQSRIEVLQLLHDAMDLQLHTPGT
jgi:plasmid stabilization system protein ParE